MATKQVQLEPTAEDRKQVERLVLAYSRLPPNKKSRVEKLIALLGKSEDGSDEQQEIAHAFSEILLPELVGSMKKERGKIAVLAEGVAEETKGKVDAYRRHVGAQIRKRRGELQMTQEELAAKAGIPQSHISRLEDGRHAPTAKTIERLARALDTDPSKLDILCD
jgi:ribosome-binding protein aMBF1 (putative translation factor)